MLNGGRGGGRENKEKEKKKKMEQCSWEICGESVADVSEYDILNILFRELKIFHAHAA